MVEEFENGAMFFLEANNCPGEKTDGLHQKPNMMTPPHMKKKKKSEFSYHTATIYIYRERERERVFSPIFMGDF